MPREERALSADTDLRQERHLTGSTVLDNGIARSILAAADASVWEYVVAVAASRCVWAREGKNRMQPELGGLSLSEAAVLPPLRPGEQIVWSGRPTTLWTLQPSDIWALLCGVSFMVIVPLIWLPLFDGGIPAPFFAFYLLAILYSFAGLITRRLSWRKVCYVLTNERAFTIRESGMRPLRELDLVDCGTQLRGLRPDGTGTVFFFGPVMPPSVQVFRFAAYTGYRYRFDFVAISDAQHVYDLAHRPVAPGLR